MDGIPSKGLDPQNLYTAEPHAWIKAYTVSWETIPEASASAAKE